jgi:hypothetical protein
MSKHFDERGMGSFSRDYGIGGQFPLPAEVGLRADRFYHEKHRQLPPGARCGAYCDLHRLQLKAVRRNANNSD